MDISRHEPMTIEHMRASPVAELRAIAAALDADEPHPFGVDYYEGPQLEEGASAPPETAEQAARQQGAARFLAQTLPRLQGLY